MLRINQYALSVFQTWLRSWGGEDRKGLKYSWEDRVQS
jgi:hypothetical protein